MLKVFHAQAEGQTLLRVIDNLFFITGVVFLLIGLLTGNTLLSIYGLSVMFISLYILQFIASRRNGATKGELSQEDSLKVKIAVLINQEKKLRQELEKTRRMIHDNLFRIKDHGFKGRVLSRFRADSHAEGRKKKIHEEDMVRLLKVYHHELMKRLSEKEKAKLRHSKYGHLQLKVWDLLERKKRVR